MIQNGFEAFETAERGTVDGLGDGGPERIQGNLHFLSELQTADGLQHPLPLNIIIQSPYFTVPQNLQSGSCIGTDNPQLSVPMQLPLCRFCGSVKIR